MPKRIPQSGDFYYRGTDNKVYRISLAGTPPVEASCLVDGVQADIVSVWQKGGASP